MYSAGGFSENANIKRAYVIYPNNNIKSTKSFLSVNQNIYIKYFLVIYEIELMLTAITSS